MLPVNAKAARRVHISGHTLDGHYPGSHLGLLGAQGAAIALLILALSVGYVAREWMTSRVVPDAVISPKVELAAPRVPARAVEALERIDLATVVSNPTDQRVPSMTLQLTVVEPDGTEVLTAKQSGIQLQAHDSRAVYWAWRVPAQLASGEYTVMVRAFDTNGRSLTVGEPASTGLQIISNGR